MSVPQVDEFSGPCRRSRHLRPSLVWVGTVAICIAGLTCLIQPVIKPQDASPAWSLVTQNRNSLLDGEPYIDPVGKHVFIVDWDIVASRGQLSKLDLNGKLLASCNLQSRAHTGPCNLRLEDEVLYCSVQGDTSEEVIALNVDLKERWRYFCEEDDLRTRKLADAGTPAVFADYTLQGRLFALSDDGQLAWTRRDTDGSTILQDHARFYASTNYRLICLDDLGNQLWECATPEMFVQQCQLDSNGTAYCVTESINDDSSNRTQLCAVDKNGLLIWKQPVEFNLGQNTHILGEYMVTTTANGLTSYSLDGKMLWQKPAPYPGEFCQVLPLGQDRAIAIYRSYRRSIVAELAQSLGAFSWADREYQVQGFVFDVHNGDWTVYHLGDGSEAHNEAELSGSFVGGSGLLLWRHVLRSGVDAYKLGSG